MKITVNQLRRIIKEEVQKRTMVKPDKAYVVKPSEMGMTSRLIVSGDPVGGGEWEDTDTEWSLDILAKYPQMPPPPVYGDGGTVGVGYGQLIVTDAAGNVFYWDSAANRWQKQ